ncbi:MAG: PQQ-binding-like beta-propeller repeat protein [Planctomycetales bacterium]
MSDERVPARIPQAPDRVRWWPAVAILVCGGAALSMLQFGEVAISGRPTLQLITVAAMTEAALFAWLLVWSRVSPINRVKVLAAAHILVILFSLAFCVEGFHGDGRPMLTWRWSPSPAALLEARREQQREHPAPASAGVVDLAQTGSDDFPQFRGPDRSGVVRGGGWQHDWIQSPPKLLWRQPVGAGWSSFAVVGDFCVTQEQRAEFETIVCYEIRTGIERWEHRVEAAFYETMGGEGPRATPTIDGGRVYAQGATGLLTCLDGRDGRPIWSRNILKDAQCGNSLFGMAGSPLVAGERVIVSPGGRSGSLAAYRADTGELLWASGSAPAAYSSPMLATLAGRDQILIFNADGLFAHDLERGDILWSFPWVTPPEMNNVCQPVPLSTALEPEGRVFLSSGYDKGCAVLAISVLDDRFQVQPEWTSKSLKAKFSSVVVRDGYVYGLDERILTCVDLRTGARRWKGGRYGFGQVLLVDDLLLVQAESGDVALVDATPERFHERARFAALDRRTWNHPVLAGRLLLVRNDREAACYELRDPNSITSRASKTARIPCRASSDPLQTRRETRGGAPRVCPTPAAVWPPAVRGI